MAEPALVAACVAAMRSATPLPVTVKCRIGVDDSAEPEFLDDFVDTVATTGCTTFIVHARKAWLQGLSPKENREIPPLRYELVRKLKERRPDLRIILNGGLRSPAAAQTAAAQLDGVMIGREAYENPWSLRGFEATMLGPLPASERLDVVEAMVSYATRELHGGVPLKSITRHMLGLFNGLPGARGWRRHLSEGAHRPGATAGMIAEAASHLRPADLAAA